ncbi:cytidine/deoxycytidylate deaminase family protein [Mycoplasma iguanae]|uniref:Cytidine/deoxycytidylate deaminase family protein n=1 Tax=Mycoplasma iguanae TaxID=292461 RepID=A0ABY5RAQ3_9MOLU|nr:cytidine/deoxycytidylate deaminase family protein [Mycoplasma iguanae]UVD81432.1 cytidine/deoxycytidylate deaminase family protein [Mycoplasma iguanae]
MSKKVILNWDQYFITLSKISALRSKDPNTQVGACIVNQEKRVIALGYNGMPLGNDQDFPWNREAENESDTKYPYVVHAEINAILNTTQQIKNAVIYTSLFPCSNCAKIIIQSGIKEVVYQDDFYAETEDNKISKYLFNKSNIKMRQVKASKVQIEI